MKQVNGGGARIAVINAVGGIQSGKSGNSGLTGKSLGSDTLIEMVRMAKLDNGIKGVVLRVDSPGGSALASDLMWREIRALSKEKPVIASMVDVAASGGYYISMACDLILAEEFTITGSIGVVTSKFNLQKLNEKIGYNTEVISRGRYAEILASNRGFTDEEAAYFEEGAQKAYRSFITKGLNC
jgi:protease-4